MANIRLIINMIFLFLFLFVDLSVACVDGKKFNISKASYPVVKIASDQTYCGGTPAIDLIYPKSVNENHLVSATLVIYDKKKEIIEVKLQRFDEINGTYICLAEKFFSEAYIIISYGEDICMPYKHAFYTEDLTDILSGKEIVLKLMKP